VKAGDKLILNADQADRAEKAGFCEKCFGFWHRSFIRSFLLDPLDPRSRTLDSLS